MCRLRIKKKKKKILDIKSLREKKTRTLVRVDLTGIFSVFGVWRKRSARNKKERINREGENVSDNGAGRGMERRGG